MLTLCTEYKGRPQHSIIKINNVLMQYLKVFKLIHKIHDEQNSRNLNTVRFQYGLRMTLFSPFPAPGLEQFPAIFPSGTFALPGIRPVMCGMSLHLGFLLFACDKVQVLHCDKSHRSDPEFSLHLTPWATFQGPRCW